MRRILWVAPNLNHYKARFINRLMETGSFDITVLAGRQMTELGHKRGEDKILFSKRSVEATKKNFNTHPSVYSELHRVISLKKFDIVLMPIEKKHFLVILFVFAMKRLFGFRLVSYNHPVTRGSALGPDGDQYVSKLLFAVYDRVIFYTREARHWAVDSGLLPAKKAFFANNTLDTREIWKYYNFEINKTDPKVILFIGRLLANKRLDLLFKYHRELTKGLPGVRLTIIGDGPEAHKVKLASEKHDLISWQGAIVDEGEIVRYMRQSHLVFVPGWSGLSIVHAFCYGRPYATIRGPHPPEIAYLKDDENGLILSGNITEDCKRIGGFLKDPGAYEAACRAAFNKAKELSIEKWCGQIITAISE